jgi:hypothetical protein
VWPKRDSKLHLLSHSPNFNDAVSGSEDVKVLRRLSDPRHLKEGEAHPQASDSKGVLMIKHTHQYTIADDEAVKVLLDKLLTSGSHQQRRERLLKALGDASKHYSSSTQKERKAFFHGLLTGYAVALKLW